MTASKTERETGRRGGRELGRLFALAGLVVVIGLVAFSGSAAQASDPVMVSTAAQLVSAVLGASAGETIEMAPGNYPIGTSLDVGVNLTVEGPTTFPGATISGGSITNPSTLDSGQKDIFAVASGATLTVHDVVLTASIQPSNAAVVVLGGGAASVDHALLSGNNGNAVDVMAGGQATVTNSTITNSIAGDAFVVDGNVTLNEDTIAKNDHYGIDNIGGGSAAITNTILSGNGLGNCFTAIDGTTNGTVSHDVDSGTTCGPLIASTGGFSNTGTSVIASSPANNGGPSTTFALPPGSVAIDNGTGVGAAVDDQRHYLRDNSPDIGAYEFGATLGGSATLTVKKVVVGGTAAPSDFTMTVTDTTTNTVLDSSPGTSSGHQVSVPAGDSYAVTESGAQTDNYVESDSAGCTGTATANGTPNCTVTNTYAAALTVKKVVVGPGQPSDFTLTVTDTTTNTVLDSSPGSSSGRQVLVPAGDSYAVTESGAQTDNYVESDSADCTGTAIAKGAPICTITNTAKPSTLTVKKVVVGGTAAPSDFTMTVTDTTTNTVLDSSPGSSSGHQVSVPAGHGYNVTESGAQTASYSESNSAACTAIAPANGTLSCTVTNTAKPTALTVKKVVVGPGQPSDFTLKVTDTTTNTVLNSSPGSSSGRQVSVPPGDTYAVSESGATVGNYTASASAGCTGTATVNGTATCTITNTAKPSNLTVTKVVVGGSAAPSDFNLTVRDTTTNTVLDSSPGTSSGHQVSVPAGHDYNVTESGSQTANYNESDSAGCSGTATADGSLSCTITDTVKPPKPTRSKLRVIVRVVGGKDVASDFTVRIHGASVKPRGKFPGSKHGTSVTLNPGRYSVTAGREKGYKGKLSGGCSGKLAPGRSAICRITETAHK